MLSIPLLRNHKCNYQCSEDCKKETAPSKIYLSDYDSDDWVETTGDTLEPDEVVIEDNEIEILFTFPLHNEMPFSFKSDTGNGFTRRELIHCIVDTYRNIYIEEEMTATPQIVEYPVACSTCWGQKQKNPFQTPASLLDLDDKECAICTNELEVEKTIKTFCGHYFHLDCINRWFYNNENCPMCQTNNFKICETCQNKGTVTQAIETIVIPLDVRKKLGNMERNMTNGIYGLWGYDLDSLALTTIMYDPETRLVNLIVEHEPKKNF